MKGLKEFSSNNSSRNFIFVESLGNLDFKTELSKLPYIQAIMKLYKVKITTIISLLKKHDIRLREIFDYSIYETSTLIEKKGVYVRKYNNIKKCMININYDVYLSEHEYIGSNISDIVFDLFKMKFPSLCGDFFTYDAPRFKNIQDFLENKRIDSGNHFFIYNKITYDEMKKLLTKKDYIHSTIKKLRMKYYPSVNLNSVYFPIYSAKDDYEKSLNIDIDWLFSKDWKSVCENTFLTRNCSSMPQSYLIEKYKDDSMIIALKDYFQVQ